MQGIWIYQIVSVNDYSEWYKGVVAVTDSSTPLDMFDKVFSQCGANQLCRDA